jgi:hypothetical protein
MCQKKYRKIQTRNFHTNITMQRILIGLNGFIRRLYLDYMETTETVLFCAENRENKTSGKQNKIICRILKKSDFNPIRAGLA